MASISPLGTEQEVIWAHYKDRDHRLRMMDFGDERAWAAPLPSTSADMVTDLRKSDTKYQSLDKSVLFAILASRNALGVAGWNGGDNFGVNIGSSRGATALFENYHQEFLERGRASTLSSPTTTLGNIASWVAHDLQTQGPEISHSITCSTALHAFLNGVAWLRSGMATKFLVGGSEAPLTPFTIAQMKALKVYAREDRDYPCRALDMDKQQNTMVLGEGSSVFCLEIGRNGKTLAVVEGLGYATEILEHNISISTDADCFQRSMKMALGDTDPQEVDVIVMHAPGTIKGDRSELNAIDRVFPEKRPLLTSNKWKIGHTFGASGSLSMELAVLMLRHQQFIGTPFSPPVQAVNGIKKVLVNAVGFGGNAVSVLLSL